MFAEPEQSLCVYSASVWQVGWAQMMSLCHMLYYQCHNETEEFSYLLWKKVMLSKYSVVNKIFKLIASHSKWECIKEPIHYVLKKKLEYCSTVMSRLLEY